MPAAGLRRQRLWAALALGDRPSGLGAWVLILKEILNRVSL